MKRLILVFSALFCQSVAAQSMTIVNQTFTMPMPFYYNLDTLIVRDCAFGNFTGDAMRFQNIGYVLVENCTFTNITNNGLTRAAICGRESDQVILRKLTFTNIGGTAIRFPTDGAYELSHRIGTVRIDSVVINGTTLPTSFTEAGGIRVFHTDSVFITNSTIKNIRTNGITIGRNSSNYQNNQRVNYLEIIGNEIDSVLGDGILSQENVLNAIVRANTISHIAYDGRGDKFQNGDHAIYWQSAGGVLEGNLIHDVLDGTVSGDSGSGISVRTNAYISANEIYNCTNNGIGYYNDHPGSDMLKIINNKVYDTGKCGIYVNGSNINNLDPASVRHPDSTYILHNTVLNQQTQSNSVHCCPVAINNMSSNNLVAANLLVFEGVVNTATYIQFLGNTSSQQQANNFLDLTDPGFVNFSNRDFHLRDTCGAVDFLPNNVAYVTQDLEGTLRIGQHDAGAYEYVITIDVSEENKTPQFCISPNPFSDRFSIKTTTVPEKIYLVDMMGITRWQSCCKTIFEVPDLPSGSYVAIMEYDGLKSCIRVIKQ